MNTSYQIVSESANLQEASIESILPGPYIIDKLISWPKIITTGSAALGLWLLNKHIRTKKVLNRYPTPEMLKQKLEECPNIKVRMIAATLRDDMSPEEYKHWVASNINPKLGVGKAILMFLFGITSSAWQVGKAAVHAGENPNKIIKRAIKNKYGMFKDSDYD